MNETISFDWATYIIKTWFAKWWDALQLWKYDRDDLCDKMGGYFEAHPEISNDEPNFALLDSAFTELRDVLGVLVAVRETEDPELRPKGIPPKPAAKRADAEQEDLVAKYLQFTLENPTRAWKARAAADPNGFGKWLGEHLALEVAPRELGPAVTPSKVDARRDYLGSIKRDSTPKPRDYSAYTAEGIGKMPDATFAGLLDGERRFRARVEELEKSKHLPAGFVETKYSAGRRKKSS